MKFDLWTLFGFFAQFIFFLRFAVQWYESEKKKKSIIPMSFWYLSIAGSLLICAYAVVRHDIVFITSTLMSLIIYIRNIILRKNDRIKGND
jgi:lipid-A-disaccharide synthase-like uncharacterized protein